MESLILDSTISTPVVNFNPATGECSLSGKSVSENTPKFYQPIFEWLENYAAQPAASTTLNIQFDYFNTSSAKILMDLFKKIEQIDKAGKTKVTVNWLYDDYDEDMQEAGENYQSIAKFQFNLVSFKK